MAGSMLGPSQALSVQDQVSDAQRLQALEVVNDQTLKEWRSGIKQTDVAMPLIRGSDAHPTVNYEPRWTWIYLPEVTLEWLRHALATHEASIAHEPDPPAEPEFWLKSIRFEGGPYDGRRIDFSPRANALIGPPSSGKSLVIDAIRYVFGLQCSIGDVQSSVDQRLAKCLPDGTIVIVEAKHGDGHQEFLRIRGGTSAPEAKEHPIVFSQVELARRSMEPIPSVALLDVHCPDGVVHMQDIEEIGDKVCAEFKDMFDLATQTTRPVSGPK